MSGIDERFCFCKARTKVGLWEALDVGTSWESLVAGVAGSLVHPASPFFKWSFECGFLLN
jgi:hypothetical protein